MSLVKIQPYITDNVANFTFGGLTITANAIFGNTNLGNTSTANFVSVSSNITSGNASLGNLATANYFSGNGSYLTGISAVTAVSLVNGSSNVTIPSINGNISISIGGTNNVAVITNTGINVTGYVNATRFIGEGGNLSNIQGSNVSGTVSSATTSGTVTTAAQPNITSVGLLTGLSVQGISSFIGNTGVVGNFTVAGSANLGTLANVYIAGGSSGYVLQTDGSGNLSWTTPPSSTITAGDVYVNNFTGDGTTTAYTLTVNPTNIKYVTVNIDGVFQLRQSYTVSGTTLTFGSAPVIDSLIEVSITVPGVVTSTVASTVSSSNQPTITSVGTLTSLNIAGDITGNLNPSANITYSLGTPTKRWKDLYLSNSTLYLGETAVSANSILPINLTIAPEVLTINVAAPDPGDDTTWLWNWQTSTLPYARTTIVNSAQVSVPLYKQGTYQINNFANEQTGVMTQRHGAHLKWVDGAGLDNLVSWAVEAGNVSFSTANINSGASTNVQRINVSVPSTVTPPTLTQPSGISYDVSFVSMGAYTIGGAADGDNKTIGPLYRGSTYTFNLAASISSHPFYLTTDNGTGFVAGSYIGEYTTGVTGSRNNGTTGKTTLVFTVPNNAPDILFYQCGIHSMMRGAIVIKDLAVETNINGNYVLYFQHTHEGHKTPVEIRPIPSLVDQMCVVYDATAGKFVPQDLATYVENTPSFKNKIREVAGTATLIAPNGVAVVPTVLVVEDTSYLPLINNKDGDIAFDSYYDTMYVWQGSAWRSTKATSISSLPGANVTGQVSNSSIAGTVYTNAQPNITSVGSLVNLDVTGNITLGGNLTVSGTTTTINSTTVSVNDLNLVLANNASSASTANGAGITINGASASMNYISSSNSFTFSHKIIADGSLLTNLTGANVTGQVGNALVASTVYTAAQPNITSVGTLTGFTSNGVVNLTNASNVSLGSIGNLKITGGSANYIMKTDGAGNLSWAAQTGGTQNYVKTYYWQGGLTENVGTLRFYIHTAATLTTIALNLVSAGLTQSTFVVKKNGTSINTITVPAGNVAVSQTGLTISLAANDYLTVDITQSSSASDAYINLIYTG